MASAEQLMSYHPQCSDIAFSDFDENRAKLFDLGADNYYEVRTSFLFSDFEAF